MRFVVLFLTAVAGVAVFLVGLARLVDPRDDFGTGVFPVVVSDARREKLEQFVIYNRERPVQGIVLGSSRSMKLRPRSLEAVFGLRFFNLSVDSARAEDYLALHRWVRRQGASIRVVIVGLDVEAFHDDDAPDSTLESNATLRTALEGRPLRRNERLIQAVRRYKSVFTTSYVADMARSVGVRLSRIPSEARASVFEADGYLRYPRWEGQRVAGTFDLEREIEECLPKYLRRFQGMTHLSARRRQALETLIAETDGARVIVWLTSIHPRTARYLEERTHYGDLLVETREYLEELHRSFGVGVHDYSEPTAYGGAPTGWYDCGHIDETNAARVATSLARDAS